MSFIVFLCIICINEWLVVNVLAIRQVKQGTETTRFRIGFTLHSCQYVSS